LLLALYCQILNRNSARIPRSLLQGNLQSEKNQAGAKSSGLIPLNQLQRQIVQLFERSGRFSFFF
jgi:hypothetical protein